MGLLKRKEEQTQIISVRVPASVKAELNELRKLADTAGFDLTATLTEALVRVTRQVRSELEEIERQRNAKTHERGTANGLSTSNGKAN